MRGPVDSGNDLISLGSLRGEGLLNLLHSEIISAFESLTADTGVMTISGIVHNLQHSCSGLFGKGFLQDTVYLSTWGLSTWPKKHLPLQAGT